MSRPVRRERPDHATRRCQIGSIPLVAVAYAVIAKLTSLTASLPGGEAPLFPPAGIALAAALVPGRQALLGIWLGSISANTIIYWNPPPGHPHLGLARLMVSVSIATGAALAAWLGAWRARRVAPGEDWFGSVRSALALLLAASLGEAAVSSVVGLLTLAAAGIVPFSFIGSPWLTWLWGDYFGCIVAAPTSSRRRLPWPWPCSCGRRGPSCGPCRS